MVGSFGKVELGKQGENCESGGKVGKDDLEKGG